MAADFLTSAHCEVSQGGSLFQTVAVSIGAYHTICRLRRGGESDGDVVERALSWLDCYTIVARALGSEELRKAGVVVRQMRGAGYSDEATTTICRALFGGQSEKDLRKAFQLFAREGMRGTLFIDMADFRRALRLMGERVDEERIDDLFDLVDADETGHLDFREFSALVRGLHPRPGAADQAFDAFRSTAEEGVGAVSSALGAVASETGSTLAALSSAWAANLRGLSPAEMRRAGLALNGLREEGFADDVACGLCRAVFCGQSDRQLRRAFRFFDRDHSGLIDADEFRRALPLIGEDVPAEHVDELFEKVDVDASGRLSFEEFCTLIRAVNPRPGRGARATPASSLSSALGRLSSQWSR